MLKIPVVIHGTLCITIPGNKCLAPADHFWWTDEPLSSADPEKDFYHPSEYAPHCMPCHWGKEEELRAIQGSAEDAYQPFPPYPGCPCTLQEICKRDERGFFETSCDAALKPLPLRSAFYLLHLRHVMGRKDSSKLNEKLVG